MASPGIALQSTYQTLESGCRCCPVNWPCQTLPGELAVAAKPRARVVLCLCKVTFVANRGVNLLRWVYNSCAVPAVQVVVHNLPWDCTWQQLKDAFADCGDIDRADVVFDSRGRSR